MSGKRLRPFGEISIELAALAAGSSAPLAVSVRAGQGWEQSGAPADAIVRRFEIGSVSKVLTGSLLGVLVEAGEVDPQAPLDDVTGLSLPWRDRPPTLAELATHQAGLPNTPSRLRWREAAVALGFSRDDPWRGVDEAAYRASVAQAAARARVGGRFRYSSMGVGLLGDALSSAQGLPFEILIRDRLLLPLGMGATSCDRPETGDAVVVTPVNRKGQGVPYLRDWMPAAGMFASTLNDLQHLLDALRAPATTQFLRGVQRSIEPHFRVRERLSVGYCWLIDESGPSPVVLHNGGTWGSQAHVSTDLGSGRGVIVLSAAYRAIDEFASRFLNDASTTR